MTVVSRNVRILAGVAAVFALGLTTLTVSRSSRGAGQTPARVAKESAEPRDHLDSEKVSAALPAARSIEVAPHLEPADAFASEPTPSLPVTKIAAAQEPNLDSDPEASAEAFVARTRQEATQAVDALTKEAAALRKRLKQVESALGRFRSTLTALDAAQGGNRQPENGRTDDPSTEGISTKSHPKPQADVVPPPNTNRDPVEPDLTPAPQAKPAFDPPTPKPIVSSPK